MQDLMFPSMERTIGIPTFGIVPLRRLQHQGNVHVAIRKRAVKIATDFWLLRLPGYLVAIETGLVFSSRNSQTIATGM
jgi:hypothetical protein